MKHKREGALASHWYQAISIATGQFLPYTYGNFPLPETPMPKKPAFPSKPCPKCGKPIHARKTSHDCGWNGAAAAPVVKMAPRKKKPGRPKKAMTPALTASGISLDDIRMVKSLVEQIGADKVAELARVLG